MRNPIRRNRRIGKTQGGRVKDGRAHEKLSRLFSRNVWRQLSKERGGLRILRENPSAEFFHPCVADDYRSVLQRLPSELTSPLKAIVLRRTPKRDVALGVEAWKRWSCVVMNAFPKSMQMSIGPQPTRALIRHYAPWCRNLDWVDYRGWTFEWSHEELRRYYLYHLFLHELGHMNEPSTNSVRRSEAFAENFALEWARRLGELDESYEEAEAELWLEFERKDASRKQGTEPGIESHQAADEPSPSNTQPCMIPAQPSATEDESHPVERANSWHRHDRISPRPNLGEDRSTSVDRLLSSLVRWVVHPAKRLMRRDRPSP